MKLHPHFCLVSAVIVLASCTSAETQLSQPNTERTAQSPKVVTLDKIKIVMSQTIYVPIYSHIYHQDRQEDFNLAASLSIRNTDQTNPLIITSVSYYGSDGKLVKQYLPRPIQLNALASTDFFVKKSDTSGGFGANFIVKWVAQTEISEPVVEAVIIGTDFHQGISFISPGRVIKRQNNRQPSSPVPSS